ncbi:MAG: hypothetical protein KAJ18_00975 [Candidatus Omnitrophica bacterium]|nr:hypothetical protein [Candidatus Omnitrophota bacterium]
MKKKMALIALVFLVIVLQGCEAVKGFTRDVANTANNIHDIIATGKAIDDVTR